MPFTRMSQQIPQKPLFLTDPTDKPQITDYQHMLSLMNHNLTQTIVIFARISTIAFLTGANQFVTIHHVPSRRPGPRIWSGVMSDNYNSPLTTIIFPF